jgi:hypothetical protein
MTHKLTPHSNPSTPQTPGRRACKRVTSAPFAGRSQSLHRFPNAVRTGIEHGERAPVHRADTLARKRRHHRFVPQHRVHVARRVPAHPSNTSINAPPLCSNQEPGRAPSLLHPEYFHKRMGKLLGSLRGWRVRVLLAPFARRVRYPSVQIRVFAVATSALF